MASTVGSVPGPFPLASASAAGGADTLIPALTSTASIHSAQISSSGSKSSHTSSTRVEGRRSNRSLQCSRTRGSIFASAVTSPWLTTSASRW